MLNRAENNMLPLKTEAPLSPLKGQTLPASNALVVGEGWDFEYDTTREEYKFCLHPQTGLLYLDRLPADSEMDRIYPSNYYAFSDEATQPKIIRIVRDFLEERKVGAYKKIVKSNEANVLDIGCGDGRLLNIIRKHAGESWNLFGIEIGESGVAAARKSGFEVVHGNIENTDVPEWNGKFDLILMHQLIEHTRNPDVLLQKAALWLKPGGVVSVETPESAGWDFRLFKKRYWGGYHFPRHFFIFNRQTLTKMAQDQGLRVLSVKSILSPVFWVHTVHNYCADHKSLRKICPYLKPSNVILLSIATAIEIIQLALTRRSSNLQVLMQK